MHVGLGPGSRRFSEERGTVSDVFIMHRSAFIIRRACAGSAATRERPAQKRHRGCENVAHQLESARDRFGGDFTVHGDETLRVSAVTQLTLRKKKQRAAPPQRSDATRRKA